MNGIGSGMRNRIPESHLGQLIDQLDGIVTIVGDVPDFDVVVISISYPDGRIATCHSRPVRQIECPGVV